MKTPAQSLGARFANLGAVRALAAFAVIVTHVGFNTGKALGNAWYAPFLARLDFGVTIFFLLSGFLLYRPFVAHALGDADRPAAWPFWRRRALRILPAYWTAVVVTLAVFTVKHHTATSWLAYLTLTQTISGHIVDPSLTQMWTLSVELSFYLALPALAAIAAWLGGRLHRPLLGQLALLGSLWISSLAFEIAAHHLRPLGLRALLWTPCYLDWFGGGMFIAIVSVLLTHQAPPAWVKHIGDTIADWRACMVIGALLWWLATLPLAGPLDLTPATPWQWTAKHALYLASAFFLLAPLCLLNPQRPVPVLGSRAATVLGDVSYGVYLWHLPILILVFRLLNLKPFQGSFFGIVAGVTIAANGVAALSWFGMERRILSRYGGGWRGRLRSPEQQPTRDKAIETRQPS